MDILPPENINVIIEDVDNLNVTLNPPENVNAEVTAPPGVNVEITEGSPGLPSGGTAGQVLKKNTSANYDASWQNETGGGGGGGTWGSITGTLSDQTDLQTELNGKADTEHSHDIADVTDLQTQLDAKADAAATTTALAGKANTGHTHSIENVTGLQAALDEKATTVAVSDVAQDVSELQTTKADINWRYWNGTGGVGTWDARPSVPAGRHVEAFSLLDPDAPAPPDAVAGDTWERHPDAPEA